MPGLLIRGVEGGQLEVFIVAEVLEVAHDGAGAAVAELIDLAELTAAEGGGEVREALDVREGLDDRAADLRIGEPRDLVEEVMFEQVLTERLKLQSWLPFVAICATSAPLLGLLGTVTGMIQTFDVITEFGTSDAKLLSGGIATALVTTELGLIVAIPCLLFGSLLNGWADRLKDDMEKAALKVINLAQDVRNPVTRAAA